MPITIRTRPGLASFWRAGVQHTQTPVTYEDGHFGASQLDALRCEPMLIVEEAVVGDGEKSDAAAGKAPTAAKAKKAAK